jgi:small multidrug resistance pump
MNQKSIAWLILAASVVSEVVGTIALKHSNGFTNWAATLGAALSFLLAIWLMSLSLKHIEMGITYSVWAGSASAAIAVIGIVLYGESFAAIKLIGLVMVVLGVVALNLNT